MSAHRKQHGPVAVCAVDGLCTNKKGTQFYESECAMTEIRDETLEAQTDSKY